MGQACVDKDGRTAQLNCFHSIAVCTGKDGVGRVFQLAPAIMRCKPTINDRWDRRVVELAAYLYRNGHCNVPEVCNHWLKPLLMSMQWTLNRSSVRLSSASQESCLYVGDRSRHILCK